MKTRIIIFIVTTITFLAGWRQIATPKTSMNKKGMVKVTILYPNGDGKTFDMDYYANKHMPMVSDLLGDSLKLLEIDQGIASKTPNEPVPFLAIGYLYFERLSAYQNAFGPNAEKILSDIPNYTNIQPVVQISQVVQ